MRPRSGRYARSFAALATFVLLAAAGLALSGTTLARAENPLPKTVTPEADRPFPLGAPELIVAPDMWAESGQTTGGWPHTGNVAFVKGPPTAFGYILMGLGVGLAVSGAMVLVYGRRRWSRIVAGDSKRSDAPE